MRFFFVVREREFRQQCRVLPFQGSVALTGAYQTLHSRFRVPWNALPHALPVRPTVLEGVVLGRRADAAVHTSDAIVFGQECAIEHRWDRLNLLADRLDARRFSLCFFGCHKCPPLEDTYLTKKKHPLQQENQYFAQNLPLPLQLKKSHPIKRQSIFRP